MLICRNRATFFPSFPNFMLGKRAKKRSYLTSFSNATSVPGKRHTATFGSALDRSHTLKALLSSDTRRSEGMRRSKGSQTISWVEYRTLWDGVSVGWRLGRPNSAILPRASRGKKEAYGPCRALCWRARRPNISRKRLNAQRRRSRTRPVSIFLGGAEASDEAGTGGSLFTCYACTAKGQGDHLVGGRDQRRWHLEAERFGGLEVDHRFILGRYENSLNS
jgi:hypothetical protein